MPNLGRKMKPNPRINVNTVNKSKIKSKTRRSIKKQKTVKLTIVGWNADGLSCKKDSLLKNIDKLKPAVFMVQESKFRRKCLFKAKIIKFVSKSEVGLVDLYSQVFTKTLTLSW